PAPAGPATGGEDSLHGLALGGCTATNDTVLVLASGRRADPFEGALAGALAQACTAVATQMAEDAEGATKIVRVRVTGAPSFEDARRGARRIAESQLVKCSLFGGDPYWGRVVS